MIKSVTYNILLFLFIFNIPIYSFIGSGYVSAAISLLILVIVPGYFKNLIKLMKDKVVFMILIIYLIFLLSTISSTTFHNIYDFTIQKTIINGVLSFISSVIFSALFYSYFKNKTIERSFYFVLLIQSFIIILMLVSPEIRNMIQSAIRSDEDIEKMAIYGGVRGLGLSDSVAFGLAATMGLLGYIFVFYLKSLKALSIYKIIIFLMCFIAALSAGRTSFLGFVLGISILIFQSITPKTILIYLKYSILSTLVCIITYFILINLPSIGSTIQSYSAYAFQPIINYIEYGSFSVSSTERLQSMYFLPDNATTIFFGDGKYTNSDGTYYMHTDSGYMRFMLYFGVLGSLIPYTAFIFFLYYTVSRIKGKNKSFFVGIIILSFIYHYKGEIVFFNVNYMKIIFLLSLTYILINKMNYFEEKREV
ncbi:hypothetical protein [Providencia vermicola]|uniref:hypothetical protein n=1 Tax=Providencia vermicola TaxID=333965 RepID=UPI001CECA3AA|nr:hypothetical protein [Providencia vermicola]